MGKIVVTNEAAVYEIRCKHGQLVRSSKGLAMFLISDDCSFTMSGQIIIQHKPNVDEFSPKYLFGLNETLVKPKKIGLDLHKIGNLAGLGFITIVISIVCIIICVRILCKRTELQYNYIAHRTDGN